MSSRSTIVLLGVLSLIGAKAQPALALPNPQAVTYHLHQTPTNFSSPIVWDITLNLTAQSLVNGSVAWSIDLITIAHHGSDGSIQQVWHEASPSVATSDGLWWIAHADPANPATSEFDRPPLLTGTATSKNSSDGDLQFSWEGRPHVNGLAAATYGFVNVAIPPTSGDNEPVQFETAS